MFQTNSIQKRVFLLTITMMSVLGLVASDIFLPAMSTIIKYFQVTPSQGQSMLGCFLFGIASMQLLYGPVSDSIGRRNLLLVGIGLFVLTALAIPHARNFEQVIALRVFQAFGACAGITLGRAIIGDLYSKEEAAQIFLTIFPVVGMSPAIAPLIGGQLSSLWGWQACFLFSACFGMVLIGLILGWLPETRPLQRRQPLSARQIAKAYRSLLTTRRFWHYAIIPCVAYAAYFAYIAESPFLLEVQGIKRSQVGYSYMSLSVTYVIGNLFARKLMQRGRTTDQLVNLGYSIFITGGCGLFLATSITPHSFACSIIAMSVLTLGNGFLLPLGTSGAVTCIPSLAGSASGLMGALQIASAALAAQYIGRLSLHQPRQFGTIMMVLALSGFALHRWLEGRHARAT
jgi:DHA1 family bicyclomycin/chloramphenicol resistance-like MFS transporter